MGAKGGGASAGGVRAGLRAIEDALDNPQRPGEVDNAPASLGKPRGQRREEDELELPLLPPGCPVEPLGVNGQVHYYLDEQRQLIGLDPQKHGKTHILALFGRKSDLCNDFWPRLSDKTDKDGQPIVTGWKPEVAAQTLMRACAMRKIFDPQGKVRGTGAHRGEDGELILHCGDTVLITDVDGTGFKDPGFIGGYVYPAGPARPRPDPSEQNTASAEILLTKLRAWNWARPLADPMLLLGWIGCAMLGGALDWRPHAWITGSSATGKSTLQKMLRSLFDGGALTTGDATEASLRQLLKQQTLPVFFDELEAEGDNKRQTAIIKLARLASSGEQALRGGQDHIGHEFTIRSCFLFSSILLPPMPVQDKNRLAILELDRIEPGKAAPTIVESELRQLGRELRRRLVDNWHRLENMVDRYKTALAAVGHSGRSGDQFGTLLAIADLLLYDVADDQAEFLERIDEWADRLRADTLAEKEAELADEEEILQFLSTSFLQQRGGEDPQPIGRHLREALAPANDKAKERLENFGLRIVERTVTVAEDGTVKIGAIKPRGDTPSKDLYLAVAGKHVGLDRIFNDTRWGGGTWSQSLSRVEGAHRRVKVRFAGAPASWATILPLPAMLDFTTES